jgi:Transposase DDE domain
MSRSDNLYDTLMSQTVLADFFKPVVTALTKVNARVSNATALPMKIYLLVSCMRHLQGQKSMREQLQHLFHLADEEHMPIARSSYSDALNSEQRASVVANVVVQLIKIARACLPDRLSTITEIGSRRIYAVDGSYQTESAHYQRQTPKEGGTDNHKGHMMLTFYDVRLGVPIGVRIETKNRHELVVLKDELAEKKSCFTNIKGSLFVLDRAFIHMSFWDERKKQSDITMITRAKNNMAFTNIRSRAISATPVNEGVMQDDEVITACSKSIWRRIVYKAPNGTDYTFLTNDVSVSPGVVAFLYLRRWDEEKCFDTWKNDFTCDKAWAKSVHGIYQQALFAVMATILSALFSQHHQTAMKIDDAKCFAKQEALSDHCENVCAERRPWYRDVYRATAKISRQIIRFLKICFLHTSSKEYYERQLKPLFLQYL